MAGGLGVLGVLLQSQTRGDDGYSAANPALRTALENAPATPKDPSAGATFDLASLLPPPRRGNAGASRPYVYYDGAQAPAQPSCALSRMQVLTPLYTLQEILDRLLMPLRIVPRDQYPRTCFLHIDAPRSLPCLEAQSGWVP